MLHGIKAKLRQRLHDPINDWMRTETSKHEA
jgi:hypothetical protein